MAAARACHERQRLESCPRRRRENLRFEVWSASDRGDNEAAVLRNSSDAPFFSLLEVGHLAGVNNRSALHHLPLPVHMHEAPTRSVHCVIELLLDGTYRVWNSEGWASRASRERSPLAGPVGRGVFPASSPSVSWTAAPTEPVLLEVDGRAGAYRAIGVSTVDLESLQPGTTRQPPLRLSVLGEGSLDAPLGCVGAATRADCAALGGVCGWCEQLDGVHSSSCVAGGPARPCAAGPATCGAWHFLDGMPPAPISSPPPPFPPGLAEGDLMRFESHSHRTALAARQLPRAAPVEGTEGSLPHRRADGWLTDLPDGHEEERRSSSWMQRVLYPWV